MAIILFIKYRVWYSSREGFEFFSNSFSSSQFSSLVNTFFFYKNGKNLNIALSPKTENLIFHESRSDVQFPSMFEPVLDLHDCGMDTLSQLPHLLERGVGLLDLKDLGIYHRTKIIVGLPCGKSWGEARSGFGSVCCNAFWRFFWGSDGGSSWEGCLWEQFLFKLR